MCVSGCLKFIYTTDLCCTSVKTDVVYSLPLTNIVLFICFLSLFLNVFNQADMSFSVLKSPLNCQQYYFPLMLLENTSEGLIKCRPFQLGLGLSSTWIDVKM